MSTLPPVNLWHGPRLSKQLDAWAQASVHPTPLTGGAALHIHMYRAHGHAASRLPRRHGREWVL